MEVAKIEVSGIWARTVFNMGIPAGIVGASLAIEYKDPIWEGLNKTVVFRGCQSKDILNAGDSVMIPAEVVEKNGVHILVGIYGTDATGEIVIPTIWASLGVTKSAADPSGDTSTNPQLPVWAQLQGMIGDLAELDTDARENLVAAINEAAKTGMSSEDVVTLSSGQKIAKNTDLDTVTAFGNYKCDTKTAATLQNHPVSAAFTMRVGSYNPDVEGSCYQEVIIRSGVRYYRYAELSSGKLKWNLWRQSFDTNNLIPARYGGMGANISSDRGETAHSASVQKFIDKMNEMAAQFGMINTVYKTPTGLCSKPINFNKAEAEFSTAYNSYTTAYDLLRLMVAVRHTPTVYNAMGSEICRYFRNGGKYTANHSNLSVTAWKNWAAENGYTIRAIKGGSLDGAYSEFGGNPIMNYVFIIESKGNTYAVSVVGLVNNDYTTLRTLVEDLIARADSGAETQAILDASKRTPYPVGMAVAKLTAKGCFDDDMAALESAVYYNGHTVYVMASLAKIMTALVAFVRMGNHECSVNYDDLVGGSSPANFKAGDTTSTIDALSLILAISDNKLATMLARICGEKIVEAGAGGGGSGEPGADGEDGFSPIAKVTQTSTGATISITDKSGTTTATIVNGKDGKDGAKGDKGDTGATGPAGAKGDKGDTGATGSQGPKGDKGDTGSSGANGKDGVSATHSWNGTTLTVTSASGTSSANLKGDKGDKGDTGATGPQGPKGDTGAQGPAGADGAKGDKGDKGDTGATGSQGPKGDKGDTGATGPQGPAGADGPAGQRGTGILNTTTGIAAYTTAVGGVTPAYRIALSTLKTQSKVNEVLVGDTVRYSTFLYPVIYVDSEYAYMTTRVSLQGTAGSAGKNGADGYTPVKGTDYFTDADKAELVNAVIAALPDATEVSY